MNLRAFGLIAAVGALVASTANGQAQGNFNAPPYSDAQAVAAGSSYGFLTSTQTAALLSAIAQSFVPGFTPSAPGATANLFATVPASVSNVGKYAVVSDLFGGTTNEVLRSGYTQGFGYYWRPQRTDYAETITTTGGAITLVPLSDAPYVYLAPGTLASSLTVSLSATNAWPGATFTVANNLTLGLLNVNVTGTGLSTSMAQGASKTFVFDGSKWRPF